VPSTLKFNQVNIFSFLEKKLNKRGMTSLACNPQNCTLYHFMFNNTLIIIFTAFFEWGETQAEEFICENYPD